MSSNETINKNKLLRTSLKNNSEKEYQKVHIMLVNRLMKNTNCSKIEAKHFVSEAILKWLIQEEKDGEKPQPYYYVYTIAFNAYVSEQKLQKRSKEHPERYAAIVSVENLEYLIEHHSLGAFNPEKEKAVKEIERTMYQVACKAIRLLSKKCRELWEGIKEGIPSKTLASRMNYTLDSFKSRKSHCNGTLQQKMKEILNRKKQII